MLESPPILFLDIDGVLNSHKMMMAALSCNIDPKCVIQLNRIIRKTGCKVVLSSAWRYMVVAPRPSMKLDGFAYMLRTHGAIGATRWLIGCTAPDEHCPACKHRHGGLRRKNLNIITDTGERACVKCGQVSNRGEQISRWLMDNDTPGKFGRYVAIDDLDLGITASGHPLVLTNGRVGLTRGKADEAIRILEGEYALA